MSLLSYCAPTSTVSMSLLPKLSGSAQGFYSRLLSLVQIGPSVDHDSPFGGAFNSMWEIHGEPLRRISRKPFQRLPAFAANEMHGNEHRIGKCIRQLTAQRAQRSGGWHPRSGTDIVRSTHRARPAQSADRIPSVSGRFWAIAGALPPVPPPAPALPSPGFHRWQNHPAIRDRSGWR